MDCRLRGRSHLREARRAFRRVACAMTRASACGSSWLSVESRRVALATIATPSRADAPRRRPVAAVRHATAAEAPATHWAGRQKARAALASATRLMSESDRASFAAYDVEFVVEISRCRALLSSPALDVRLPTALQVLQVHQASAELGRGPPQAAWRGAVVHPSGGPSAPGRRCWRLGRKRPSPFSNSGPTPLRSDPNLEGLKV